MNATELDAPLNRPCKMARLQDACIDSVIEEAEQLISFAKLMTLGRPGTLSSLQRPMFERILADLRRDLERFTSDALLVIGDGQEIGRRIDAR